MDANRNRHSIIFGFISIFFIFFFILSFPKTVKAETPYWGNPFDTLQIKIPGMEKFTEASPCPGETDKMCITWIGEYIAGIYKYAISLVGILATVVMMFGGALWLTAGGNPSRIGEAKAWITASLTGLIIALSSYMILYQINPKLVGFGALEIQIVKKIEELAAKRAGGTAETYKNMSCPTTAELQAGVNVYATGYYQPPRGNDHRSLCIIAMNCSCPDPPGRNMGENCDDIFPDIKNYRPCNPFPETTPYCTSTASGKMPLTGDIAAPDCVPLGTTVCVDNKTYKVADRGSAIQGRRIDIWSGSSLDAALNNTGETTMKLGPCP